jgi:hypothetical protein
MLPEPALPDAAFAARLASGTEPFVLWQGLALANALAKRPLINRQRVEKSLSPGGRAQLAGISVSVMRHFDTSAQDIFRLASAIGA